MINLRVALHGGGEVGSAAGADDVVIEIVVGGAVAVPRLVDLVAGAGIARGIDISNGVGGCGRIGVFGGDSGIADGGGAVGETDAGGVGRERIVVSAHVIQDQGAGVDFFGKRIAVNPKVMKTAFVCFAFIAARSGGETRQRVIDGAGFQQRAGVAFVEVREGNAREIGVVCLENEAGGTERHDFAGSRRELDEVVCRWK